MKAKKGKTKIAQCRIPESFYDGIEAMAAAERRKITDMVRILIEDGYLQRTAPSKLNKKPHI